MEVKSSVNAYLQIVKTPTVQVVLLGGGFLLLMLFATMEVLAPFDQAVIEMLVWDNMPGVVQRFFENFTALGSNEVLIFFSLAVAGWLKLTGHPKKAFTLLIAVAAGLVITFVLKAGIDRPRPPLSGHQVTVLTQSFPSAHAMMSTLVYFCIARLFCFSITKVKLKVWVYSLTTLLVFMIGLSRVQLGVHWPTDVIAGWLGGGAIAAFSFYVIKWQRNLRIRSEHSK
ncbi:phosphatase PAP2 family protein [Alteromonas sp. CI.11.F.A3]|uniref:phosphatase PAP2 family protein n=1 Tax=Alteromonas sp. CI.11.F.A3 TaxID=3079555 RepID=UPI002942325F|nr:phosphatase PAP2 family protein [Alteromonas sp. CI.11.F.A3]WOI36983.1 phosphatase PAP2 family protein [Alteromonas sp. CI.11.F.A3]